MADDKKQQQRRTIVVAEDCQIFGMDFQAGDLAGVIIGADDDGRYEVDPKQAKRGLTAGHIIAKLRMGQMIIGDAAEAKAAWKKRKAQLDHEAAMRKALAEGKPLPAPTAA